MATLLDVKQRIIAETHRDDLEDDYASLLQTHIERACEYHADTKFWFNSTITTATTTGGSASVTVPATVRIVERVTVPSLDLELQEDTLDRLCEGTGYGEPRRYAYLNGTLRLYPIPGAAYTLNIYGVAQVDAPASDATENVWTDEAQDLIVAHTKMTLYRGLLRDAGGVELAQAEVIDALNRLRRETARKLKAPLRANWSTRVFDPLRA